MAPNIKSVGKIVSKQGAQLSKDDKKRNYEKPWLVPEKEKKEPDTFLEYCYPEGAGPDADLI